MTIAIALRQHLHALRFILKHRSRTNIHRIELLEGRQLFTAAYVGGVSWGEISEDNGATVTLSENWFDTDFNTTRSMTVSNIPEHVKLAASFGIDAINYINSSGDQDILHVSIEGGESFDFDVADPNVTGFPMGDDVFAHSGNSFTISFTGSGFEEGDQWFPGAGVSALFNTITISGTGSAEEGDSGAFVVSRDNDPNLIDTDVTVNLQYSGDAESGVDYTALPTNVTIHANELSHQIAINTTPDDHIEDEEHIVADVAPGLYAVAGGVQESVFGIKLKDPFVVLQCNDAGWDGQTLTIKKDPNNFVKKTINVYVESWSVGQKDIGVTVHEEGGLENLDEANQTRTDENGLCPITFTVHPNTDVGSVVVKATVKLRPDDPNSPTKEVSFTVKVID